MPLQTMNKEQLCRKRLIGNGAKMQKGKAQKEHSWRQTEHRNKEAESTTPSQGFTGGLSNKRACNLREGKGYSLYVPKLNSTWFSLETSSKFSNDNYKVFLVILLLGTTHLP